MVNETYTAKIALIVGIVLMLGLPWLLTRNWGAISFLETGSIGDTIGGITAPISGFLGAYLVFLALKAQVEANRILKDQMIESSKKEMKNNEVIIIEKLLWRLEKKIVEFKVTQPDTYKYNPSINGQEGIRAVIINLLSYSGSSKSIEMMNGYIELHNLLDTFDYILSKIEQLAIEDRKYFIFVFEDIYSGICFDTGVPDIAFMEINYPNESVGILLNRFISINSKIWKSKEI